MSGNGIDDIVIIPMTIASSRHNDGSVTLEQKFKLDENGKVTIDGKNMFITYTSPVGTHDGVSMIVEDLIKPYI